MAHPAPVSSERRAILGHVLPFALFAVLLALEHELHWPPKLAYPIRLAFVVAALVAFSRPYLSFRPVRPLASIAIGAAVFAIWVGPDILFNYRHFWLFENGIMGSASSSATPDLRGDTLFILFRCVGCALVVPVMEELFWRGFLMRWVEGRHFLTIPLGAYFPFSFWAVAVLFALEHGPYWEVGLAAGIAYNWWIVRTRCLADCIIAHAITNALLSYYVLVYNQWQYWL